MKDLFNNPQYLESCDNPIKDKDIPQISHVVITRETVTSLAQIYNDSHPNEPKTIEEYAMFLGYEMDKNGDFIKDLNKPLNIK